MFCTHCGTRVDDGSSFCTHCGASLASSAPASQAAPSPAQSTVGASGQAAPVSSKSRTVVQPAYQGTAQEALNKAQTILASHGYRQVDYHGELVWKKGTGIATAMEYIKPELVGQALYLSGWIQIGVGSVGGKDHSLEGIVGAVPKRSVRRVMDEICANL